MTWPTKKLGELLTKKPQYGFTVKASRDDNDFLYLRITDITDDGTLDLNDPRYVNLSKNNVEKYCITDGDVLIARTGSVGRAYVVKEKELPKLAIFASYLVRFSLSTKLILPEYFFLFSRTKDYWDFVQAESQTTSQPNLNAQKISNLPIPLPPIEIQKKIVEKIEGLFAKIDEASRLCAESLSASATLLPSALHHIFSRAEKEGWEEKEFSEIVKIDTTRNIKKNLPFIGMEDIEIASGNFIGGREPKEVKSNSFHFDTRHVLYGKLRPYLNKVFVPDFEGHCTTEFLPLLPNKRFLIREWLAVWLRYEKTVENIMATTTGSRMPRANMNKVKEIKIPLPPIPEQRKIVAYLDSLYPKYRMLQELQKQTSDDLSALKQSILSKSFNEGI